MSIRLPLTKSPVVKSVMTPFPYSIDIDAELEEARAMMREHGIRHLPVKQDGKLAAILSDRDLRPGARTVRDVCVREALSVDLNAPLDRVAQKMAELHMDAALVTRNERLAGIFTATDACACLAALLRERFGGGDGGEAA